MLRQCTYNVITDSILFLIRSNQVMNAHRHQTFLTVYNHLCITTRAASQVDYLLTYNREAKTKIFLT